MEGLIVMKTNEKGMTLIEVLATFVITSIFVGIIYGAVIIAMNYHSVETTKTKLQQEANYIITEIQRIHRQCESYRLIIESDKVEIKECVDSQSIPIPNTNKIISSNFVYTPVGEEIVRPNQANLKLPDFSVGDTVNENLTVEIPTEISRFIEKEQTSSREEEQR